MSSRPVTVLADRIPPLQWSLIEEAITQCANVRVVAKDIPASELRGAIDRFVPDVLILGARETFELSSLLEDWISSAAPKRRIITLFDGPRVMQLREWRLAVETLDDISIESLCAAIEGRH